MIQKNCGKCGVVLNIEGMVVNLADDKYYIRCPVCGAEVIVEEEELSGDSVE